MYTSLGHGPASTRMRLAEYRRRAIKSLYPTWDGNNAAMHQGVDLNAVQWVINLSTGECRVEGTGIAVVVPVDEFVKFWLEV